MDGYVKNSMVVARDGDTLFVVDDDGITPQLDGYAVIPKEKLQDAAFIAELAAQVAT